MPVKKEDAYHALELLEDYYNRLSKPQDRQLRNAIEKVIEVFKSRLFHSLIEIQEYYEVTLLDEGKTLQDKTVETNQVTTRWERPSTNNIILPPAASTSTDLEEPLPSASSSEINKAFVPAIVEDIYAKPIKSGPKPVQPPPEQIVKVSATDEAPPIPPKPQTAPKPKKAPKPQVIEVLDDLPPPPPTMLSAPMPQVGVEDADWEYEEVTLKRGSAGLGISIAGGTDTPHVANDSSIFVTNIVDGGTAALDGRLRINDVIMSVNGVSMVDVTHADSVQVLKQAGKTVVLSVKRQKDSEEMVIEINLVKGSRGLGFSIAGGVGNQHIAGDNGVFVTKVIDGGAAQQDGQLMVGDRLISVNDVNLENVDHETAVATLKATKQQVKLVVGRPAYSAVDGPAVAPSVASVPAPTARVADVQPMEIPIQAEPPPISATKPHTKKKKKTAAAAATLEVVETPPEAGPSRGKRKIVLTKGSTGLGFNIVGGDDGEGIFVSFILPGGQADLSGALFIGDQLLSVNGIDLQEANHEQAAAVLKSAGERVEIIAQHKPDEYAQFDARIRDLREQLMNTSVSTTAKSTKKQSLFVRALFDYDPDNDSELPSRGLAFRYGDILRVINASDDEWWQARSVVPEGDVTGIIPGKLRVERKERVRLKSIKKKKKKKGLDHSKEGVEEEEERVLSYETVTNKEISYTRPVIVFGPLKDRVNDDLMAEFPDQFGSCVPHTSRPPRDHEVHGRDYYFAASREQMERDIENQLFVEAGQFSGNLYGTSIQSVKDVCNQGRHCILDVGAPAIKRLQVAGVYPIAVFLKPTSAECIIDWLGNLSEDQARKQFDRTMKLYDEFGDQFTAVISGTSADDVYDQVKAAITEHSGPVVWVPTNQPL